MKGVDQDRLVRGCILREPGAWEEFVRRYGPFIMSIALRCGLSEEVAFEALQETYVTIWRSLDTLRDTACLASWIGTIARRKAQGVAQRLKAWKNPRHPIRDPRLEMDAAAEELPEEQVQRLEMAQILRDAVDGLCEPHRTILQELFLRHERVDYGLIAKKLGVAVTSIGPMRGRALEVLRVRLQSLEGDL